MSTNSSITVKFADGTFHSVYCHWDGYLEGVGQILLQHYNSQELAEGIVNIGDLSCLDETIECPDGHSFENKADKCSVFYGRDRGEKDVFANIKNTYGECLRENKQEYNYLWDGEQWLEDEKPFKV